MISAQQHTAASLQHSKGSLRPPLLHFRPAVSRTLVVRRYRCGECLTGCCNHCDALEGSAADSALLHAIQQLRKLLPSNGAHHLLKHNCLTKQT